MTKLEQIEKLRERANVSYDEAKAALEEANGDLLDAIIALERQGKVNPPEGGGYYSSARTESTGEESGSAGPEQNHAAGETFTDALERLGRFCAKIIDKGNTTNLEVLKDKDSKTKLPLTVLALLMVFLYWLLIPLMVIGFVLGYRYRIDGFTWGDDE